MKGMADMEIRYDKVAVKFLQGLPRKLRDSIREAIKGLTQKPPQGDIKRLVLAWDPDFTKLTPEERKRLEAAEQRINSGEYVKDSDIDWECYSGG